ncbi:MAG: hypothetical protein ABI480_16035, partial [Chitinophagaceae bacterium]
FIITCFIGLAGISIVFTALSLFIPLGNVYAQLLLLIPALYWAYKKKLSASLLKKIIARSKEYSTAVIAGSLSAILLILVMHANWINHPDTLAYHAQNIQWIEKYRVVPGTANLYLTYGIQSSWFVLSALFSFSFTGTHALSFINAVVLCWFIIFIGQQLQACLSGRKKIANGIGWLLLLAFSFWSYTQIRLTASSGSPDFIATMYTWLIIYLFINRPASGSVALLILFLSCFAVTIKLSALPCLLFGLYAWFRRIEMNGVKKIIYPLLITFVVLAPSLTRNVISSGYLVFPSAVPDVFAVDWKVPASSLAVTQQYITAYARTNVNYNNEQIQSVLKMSMSDWIPAWWQLRSWADRIILLGCPILLILSLFSFKKLFHRKNEVAIVALLFSLTAIVFWFIQAPDPRFGFGFLMAVPGILLYLMTKENDFSFIKKQWLSFGLFVFSAAAFSYTGYRCVHFFNAHDLLAPAGVIDTKYEILNCDRININMPHVDQDCGNAPVPCATTSCIHFMARGNEVKDGFKAK